MPTIKVADQEYDAQRGSTSQLQLAVPTTDVTPELSGDLMETIYKNHFVRGGSPSRAHYEEIRMAPALSICPICVHRIVSTPDHYLPQSRGPK